MIIMEGEEVAIKERMTSHLKELMSDADLYGWGRTRAIHGVWLNQLQLRKYTWMYEEKLQFRRALVWHPAHSSPSHSTTTTASQKTRECVNQYSYNAPVRHGAKTCKGLQQGQVC